MGFYKSVVDGYILSIYTSAGQGNITKSEYDEILEVIQNKPSATETTDYKLRDDLTWEEYQIEPPDPDPEIDDSKALEILLGGDAE